MADHHTGNAEAATVAETARLTHLVRTLSLSARLQGDRATAEADEARARRREVALLRTSLFWRLSAPARFAVDIARGRAPFGLPLGDSIARARAIAAAEGWRAAFRRIRASLRHRRRVLTEILREADPVTAAADDPCRRPVSEPPGRLLSPNIVIVAELTLPQCAKYRVWQKQEHFQRLGVPCRVVNWHDTSACHTAVALATAVIFYRVPGFPPMLALIEECKRLGLPIWWEVDDLIFDAAEYMQNRNLGSLNKGLRQSILSGVPLYRAAMLACGRGIASTPRLAQAMHDAGLADVQIIENALDKETLTIAARYYAASPLPPRKRIVITYGSGTSTHNADFAVAVPGLLAVMRAREDVQLRIVGDLSLPPEFKAFAGRVEQLPKTHYAQYLERLADSDINLAPLEDTIFNDAKSNIKFLEAGMLSLASVCSPRATFRDVVEHGANGMLAGTDAEWESALLALVDDATLRKRLGEAARRFAMERYAPAAVARRQVAPLVERLDKRAPAKLRILVANVYFWPRSFGGATIVAEEMARRLHARDDAVVYVATGDEAPSSFGAGVNPEIQRYDMPVPGRPAIMVAGLRLPPPDPIQSFDNPALEQRFGELLDAVRPDVVHLHALQGLSAAIARACLQRRIPYVITLHDAWWICARQFMVQADGKYCFQTSIDLRICEACMPGARYVRQRYDLLLETLRGAAMLLAPSESHRQLHIAQGLAADRIIIAPNGVRHPAEPPGPRPLRPDRLSFAYVGGDVDVKGISLVRQAFEALRRSDWRLVLVDNTLNLGFSSLDATAWHTRGVIETVPAYTQETMDGFFAGIDVLVFPSQWKESFGLTVREALLRGVWVIATEGGGPAEVIEDGVNGTLIPLDGNPARLRAALEDLLAQPARLAAAVPPADIIDFARQADDLYNTLKRAAAL